MRYFIVRAQPILGGRGIPYKVTITTITLKLNNKINNKNVKVFFSTLELDFIVVVTSFLF